MEEEQQDGNENGDGMSKQWDVNSKVAFDQYQNLAIQTLGNMISQNQALFAATIDNVRNLQQAHNDHVRNSNVLTHLATGGFKTLEEKQLDTTAHEVAAETASIAAALGTLNSTNRQTDSTTAQLAGVLSSMTAAINQMQSSLDSFVKNNEG